MLKLVNTTEPVRLYIDKSTDTPVGTDLTLKLRSRISNKEYTFNVQDEGTYLNYYCFDTVISGISNGEYEYTLMYQNILLHTGLLVYGDYNRQETEYQAQKETIVYNG